MKRKNESGNIPEKSTTYVKKKKRGADEEKENLSQQPDFHLSDEAEVGIVEKIDVKNFMCHKYLEVKLGSNINFVIGRNGSGKSAILTALIVGLGGKAATTNRGQTLKGFIKEGCNSCTVRVQLRNRGDDAYKPDLYGDSIIVERRLSSSGLNETKLKSNADKLVSTKKDELTSILDHFNIQIDNPVSILNQETSRAFLNTTNEKDKYKFFLKATQLEQMTNDYQKTIEDKAILQETLDKKKRVLPELHAEVKRDEEKYLDIEQLKGMSEKVKLLKNELVWTIVHEKKEDVERLEQCVDQVKSKLPKFDTKIQECVVKEEELSVSWDKHNEKTNEIIEQGSLLGNERRSMVADLRQKKMNHNTKKEILRKLIREKEQTEKEREALVNEIANIKSKLECDLEAERAAHEEQLSIKHRERETYEAQLATSQHQHSQLDLAIKRSKETQYKLRQDVHETKRKVEKLRHQLQQLEANQSDQLAVFGPATGACLKAIDSAGSRFHKKPIGPIGSVITLRDQRWALAVENCIQANMLAYCCHDNHDRQLLQEIFRKHVKGKQPSIIVNKFQDHVYNMGAARPHCDFPTIYEMLQITNPVVANALIDMNQVETVLLIENGKDAQDLLFFNCPQNAWKAFSLDGQETIGGHSTKSYASRQKRAKFLQVSSEELIVLCERDLKGAQEELKQLQEEQRQIETRTRKDQEELNRTKQKCQREQDLVNRISIEIQEISSQEEEQIPDIAAFLEEVDLCLEKINKLAVEIETAKSVSEASVCELQETDEKAKDCQRRVDELLECSETLKNEQVKVEDELQEVKSNKKHYQDKKEELIKILKDYERQFEEHKEEYEASHEKANRFCEEVSTTKSKESLESKIDSMMKRIAREEKSRGNAEEITLKYQMSLKRYKETKDMIKSHAQFRKFLQKALERRAKRYTAFMKYIVVRAKHYFEMLLSQRGYTGRLSFDHATESLHVQVNVDQAKGASTKDSKSLSGGERSYSTICFIMALWEAMEAPFRCLDEFDVFMDMLNRRISMDMLLKIAKEQHDRQFILLTPQDMSNVSGGRRVKIFRLNDPERDQRTIEETMPQEGNS